MSKEYIKFRISMIPKDVYNRYTRAIYFVRRSMNKRFRIDLIENGWIGIEY